MKQEKPYKILKMEKPAGNDGIKAEMIKFGGDTAIGQPTNLCNNIWTTDRIPTTWKGGIIIQLPKKGDLRECTNWRGITLSSIPRKIMAKMMLNRMRLAMDERLRQEQAGFRPGRSCCKQIFPPRQIIEETVKQETPMLINFVDFKKAFDSVHGESLWKIMKSYEIPQRIIYIIQDFYDGSRCAVRHGGEKGERFQIIKGVRQGCALSPLIFALVVDWVMTRVMSGKDTGIRWVNGDRLGDLDFADDIALLENSWKGMKDPTDRTQKEAAKFGLNIHPEKTKIMKVGRWDEAEDEKIMIDGRLVESVDAFCYLGSVMAVDSSCDREIKVRIGRANATFGRFDKIWKKNGLKI